MRKPVHIAPLVMFRIVFGALMFFSITRFMTKGWVHSMYVAPRVYFPFFELDWLRPLPEAGMYVVFVLMLICSLSIMTGTFYRVSAIMFFTLFSYVELLDKTNYLNHYYFISLVSFVLIFVPAHRAFSFDNLIFRRAPLLYIPRTYILVLQVQLFIVYLFAGIAKVNSEWLLDAQPLRTWLPAFSHFPLIGQYMEQLWVAYFFSWFGCLYDLSIGFLLFKRRTVYWAYFFVVVFHAFTALFFNIGMFPYIMICATLIFFPQEAHIRILNFFKPPFNAGAGKLAAQSSVFSVPRIFTAVFIAFFTVQVLLPFRYLLYKGDLFWTEQGYRFSWRVMLMEKAGAAFFYVTDKTTGKQTAIVNGDYLTYMQEKMMATQPDMMVDYARFLKKEFKEKGYKDPVVTVQSYVTLNGSGSREFVDPTVDLGSEENQLMAEKTWVRSY